MHRVVVPAYLLMRVEQPEEILRGLAEQLAEHVWPQGPPSDATLLTVRQDPMRFCYLIEADA